MRTWVSKFFGLKKKPTKIAFIDGDQYSRELIDLYKKYVAKNGYETHFISMQCTPKKILSLPEINVIRLSGYRPRKEVTDKFIASFMQKAVSDGYIDIVVMSRDYDFIDMFKMISIINDGAKNLRFTMVVPNPQGELKAANSKINNVRIIK